MAVVPVSWRAAAAARDNEPARRQPQQRALFDTEDTHRSRGQPSSPGPQPSASSTRRATATTCARGRDPGDTPHVAALRRARRAFDGDVTAACIHRRQLGSPSGPLQFSGRDAASLVQPLRWRAIARARAVGHAPERDVNMIGSAIAQTRDVNLNHLRGIVGSIDMSALTPRPHVQPGHLLRDKPTPAAVTAPDDRALGRGA